MKALVTGGGGFLGLYLVEQLVARGDTVRSFSRARYTRLDELGVEQHSGDIQDRSAVARACDGVEAVFHTAAVPGIWGPWKHFHGINTIGTENVLAACNAHRVPKLIYTSSPSVIYDGREHRNVNEDYPYPARYLCHYPHSKALAEKAVLAANGRNGLATVALRPHLIWGPRDNHLIPRLIARARSGKLKRVGNGDNLISVSYVENAAAAHLQAADSLHIGSPSAGRAYFINEIEPVNLWKWVDDILSRAGLPAVRKHVSAKAAKVAGAVLEAVYGTLGIQSEPLMTRFLASQLSGSHYYDVARARRDFGYNPQVPFEEGMRRLEPELRKQ
ncbi:MAG: NAD-dependent epimerase/dehydratase family protein [Planctomycetaceae bacterium]